MPFRLHYGVTLAVGAIVHSDACSGQEIGVIFAHERLVFIITVDDERWQIFDAVGLVHHVYRLVIDRIKVIIDSLRLLRTVRVDQLKERVRRAV